MVLLVLFNLLQTRLLCVRQKGKGSLNELALGMGDHLNHQTKTSHSLICRHPESYIYPAVLYSNWFPGQISFSTSTSAGCQVGLSCQDKVMDYDTGINMTLRQKLKFSEDIFLLNYIPSIWNMITIDSPCSYGHKTDTAALER